MYPIISVFGLKIGTYGLCILIGIGVGILLATYLGQKRGLLKDDVFNAVLYAVLGMGVGGKLLYFITDFSSVVYTLQNASSLQDILPILTTGFVFYGGFIGGVLMIYIYCKQYKCSIGSMFEAIIPAMPLVHALGRVGCFFAGCCYGIPYDGIGSIIFTQSIGAPHGIPLFPTQLVEAGLNLIICLVLLRAFFKKMNASKMMVLYVILYSMMRFGIEFLRGDLYRGVFYGLSTSQWISLALFGIGIGTLVFLRIKEKPVK